VSASILQSASRALGLIGRTISYKSKAVLLRLYKTLVRPHVEYCISAWSPYYVKDKQLLEHIQHRFTQMVPGLKSLPYEERPSCLGLWTLEERRNRADPLEVFKMYKGLSLHFNEFFKISSVVVTRGHWAKIDKQRCRFTKTFLLRESGIQMEFFAATCHRRWEYLPVQKLQECYWEIALYTDGPLHGLERSAWP